MKIADWIRESTHVLEQADVPTARLDCLVLLEDLTNTSRAHILAHPEEELSVKHIAILAEQLKRRSQHIPLAFIRGRTEFYGRDFILDDNVLEPRPESETIIELLKRQPIPSTIIDIGTGSGALAITAKLEVSAAEVRAVDIDAKCLTVAKQNSAAHKTVVSFSQGDLFEPYLSNTFERLILLTNLPYVPDDYTINQAAMNEPRLAIFGGQDGLDLYRRLFKQLTTAKADSLEILTESLPFQHQQLRAIASEHGFTENKEEDFIQLFTRG